MRIASILLLLVALVLFGVAGHLYYRETQFLAIAMSVTGTVENFRISESAEGGSSYCPLINYTTQEGETFTYDSHICSSPRAFEVGEQVKMLYDPSEPERAQMDTFWGKNTGPVIAGGIALTLFVLAIGGMIMDLVIPRIIRSSQTR